MLAGAGLEISEFLAKNDEGIRDQFDKREDWIEIHNNSPAAIDLGGYFLTDNQGDLDRWEFPSVILEPDQYLVVFASGNDLKNPAAPLHTNFSLNDAGEYLALVAPDRTTVVDHFAPTFPAQSPDMAYGVGRTTQSTPLITGNATPRVRVPTAADAGLGWTGVNYPDAANWPTRQLAVGFDADPVPVPGAGGFTVRVIDTGGNNIGDISNAKRLLDGNSSGFTVTSDLTTTVDRVDFMNGGRYQLNLPLPSGATAATPDNDPLREGYALRATSYVTIPQGTYTVAVRSDDGFQLTIAGVTFTNRVNENYQGSTSAADQITYGAARGPAETLGTFTVGPGGLTTSVTLDFYENGGGDAVELMVASGSKGGWDSSFALMGNGTFGWGVYRDQPTPHYDSIVKTDLQAQMLGVNAGAYLRLPFTLESATDYDALRLRVKYDDGFVAYVNGVRVMSRNAPATALWDSAATASRADELALRYEEFLIPGISQHLVAGVNVLAIHALNASTDDPDFLIAPELDGVRTLSSTLGYFAAPTPGGPNSLATLGKVADTKFSKDRGFYDQAFPVTITSATVGAQIRYTLDGSAPTATTGLVYGGPITVTKTTVLRAAAFKAGYLPSDVDTQTYLFLADVLRQPAAAPAGYPTTWNGTPADYEMDPDVVDSAAYAGQMVDALKSIPTMSLVLNKDDMFGSQGLYVNLSGQGVAWERPTSMEMIYADGRDGVQINAGLRIQGGAGRNPQLVSKHSFRLVFSERTGPTKLEFPLFDGSRVTEFDTITLRAGFNNSWNFTSTSEQARATYTQDEWMRVTQRAMGQVAGYGNFVHLYINGMYWGLYNPTERPSAPFAADWYGGDKEDWDALNSSEPIDGDKEAWDELQRRVNGPGGASAPTANWLADDARYALVKEYLDVDNFIDYMLLNFYGGNNDWDDHNWYAARRRAPGEGYKFFSWDGERTLESATGQDKTGVNQADKPSRIYAQLRANAEFRMRFADRAHKHLFNGGALSVAANQQRYTGIMAQIDKAIIGESARWGDSRRATPYTRNVEWVAERNRVLNQYFPVRGNTLLTQLRAGQLYPTVNAPVFNQWGGTVSPSFNLTMTTTGNPAGTIYYTLDGTDPRLPGGGVAPGAVAYTGPVNLGGSKQVKARFLTGTTWSALDDVTFFAATPPALRVSEVMYHPPPAPAGSVFAKDDFEYVEVVNTGAGPLELGGLKFTSGITFTFPQTTLAAGERTVVVRNLTAFQSRYGTNVATAGVYTDQLDNAGERIRLETALGQVIQEFTYDDDWHASTDGGGYSLVAVNPAASNAVLSTQAGWRPSTPPAGAPGLADPGVNHNAVVVNEVAPSQPAGADGDWIELRNTTNGALDVGGWYVSDSASNLTKYRIAPGTVIPANGYLVLSQAAHFGNLADPGTNVAFSLADGGSAVFLTGGDGAGGLSGYRDSVDYAAVEPGAAVGRYVKSTGRSDFAVMAAATRGANNAVPRVGPIVINEINYNPVGFGLEFVELHNVTGEAVALHDGTNPWRLTDAIGFEFPAGAEIPAGGYAIVTEVDPATFRATYNVPAHVQVWGPFTGNLDNAGESLELVRPGAPDGAGGAVPYFRVDKVTYDGSPPWPAAANGGGPTLARIAATAYGNDAANWQTYGSGGTPGLVNTAVAPAVALGAGPATAGEGLAFTRGGSFSDANAGEAWTAVVSWGDAAGFEPLALNADKTFTLNHVYAARGTYAVTVRVTDSLGVFGTATLQVNVVDQTAPAVTATPTFTWQTRPHKVTYQFGEDVSASLAAEDFVLTNAATGAVIDTAGVQVSYDAAANEATFALAEGLPDGDYRARLVATGVRDGAGNAMAADAVLEFFVYAGDATRDRTIDFADLVRLAQSYDAPTGKTAADGDFNYDGAVDFADLVILAQRYETTLGGPAAPADARALSAAMAEAFDGRAAAAVTPTPIPPAPPAKPKKVEKPEKPVFSTTPVKKVVAQPTPAKPRPAARR